MARILSMGGTRGEVALEEGKGSRLNLDSLFIPKGVAANFLQPKHDADSTFLILPAFDMNADPSDTEFQYKYAPFMEKEYGEEDADPTTKRNPFTAWMFTYPLHRGIGRGVHTLLSPSIVGGKDPFHLCFVEAWKRAQAGDSSFQYLYDSKSSPTGSAVLPPRAGNYTFMNVVRYDKNHPEAGMRPEIIIMTHMGTEALKKMAVQSALRSDAESISPEWPDFRYGDFTDPMTGACFMYVEEVQTSSGKNPATLHPLRSGPNAPLSERNPYVYGNDPAQLRDLLGKRYPLYSGDFLRIPSFEELVAILIDEFQAVPYDYARRVCEPYYEGTFPTPPVNATHSTPGHSETGSFDQPLPIASAPAMPATPTPQATPAAPAAPAPVAAAPAPVAAAPAPVAPAAPAPVAAAPASQEGPAAPQSSGLPQAPGIPSAQTPPPSPAAAVPVEQASEGWSDAKEARYAELMKIILEDAEKLTPELQAEFAALSTERKKSK